MNDEDLRALVRATIARHAGTTPGEPEQARPHGAMVRLHASHGTFTLPVGTDGDGPCLIEPAVLCNHCGYCQSYGH
ncbi:MAG: hypothetical protein EXQ59_03580 [Acidobacteria bacterium]|nr:hypothetical protein [Acidobacteriota bacterium]